MQQTEKQYYAKNKSYLKLLQGLWHKFELRRKKQLILLVVLMVLCTFLELLSVGAVLPFLAVLVNPAQIINSTVWGVLIPDGVINEQEALLKFCTLAFVSVILISGLARFLQIYLHTKISHAIGADISSEIYRKTLYQPYIVHTKRNASEIISAIVEKTDRVVGHTIMPMLSLLSATFTLGAVFITIAYLDVSVAVGVLTACGLLYGAILLSTKSAIGVYSEIIDRSQDTVIKVLQEGLGSIRETIIDGTQIQSCKEYEKRTRPLRSALASIQIYSGSPRIIVELTAIISLIGFAYQLGRSGANEIVEIVPLIGVLTLGVQRLLPIIQQAYAAFTLVRGSGASLRATLGLLEQPVPDINQISQTLIFENSITINEASYRYADDAPWALKDVCLEIKKGSKIGIVGETGSGKSTLVDLIMGLLFSEQATIKIDGVPLDQSNSSNWHHRIAHVPQTIFLFDTTIAENIAFIDKSGVVDMERVKEAARLARVEAFVNQLPDGFSTCVGERGVRLSGGQRQRIGIARALYKRADVLILDEATSALDFKTEEEIMTSLECLENNITIITIAHRISTLRHCDVVVEMKRGKVFKIASYDAISK